jgi:two-component system phosphate regulon sensor histidine kinase PhoR
VANASHELQTPITAIKAMTETLVSDGRRAPELAERFLPDLEHQADRLGALVRDLLDLAALEAGPVPLERAPVDLAELAEGIAASRQSLSAQRGVSVKIEMPDDMTMISDRSALTRILSNLLDNALKYTEAGGQVGIQACREKEAVAITVWDTGIGIPVADLPRIFERFYRVDKARSRDLGGTGLGLAIVKHLVEALGGEISVESRLGEGSRFTVRLPASAS